MMTELNIADQPKLNIDNILIRQDDKGRYSANDLHKASGGQNKDQPTYWLRLDQTKALIAELEDEQKIIDPYHFTSGNPEDSVISPITVVEGRSGGTYICKELVYAYGMWISPKLHLKIIRTFDALMTQGAMERIGSNVSRLKEANRIFKEHMNAAKMLNAPKDIAIQKAHEHIKNMTGLDLYEIHGYEPGKEDDPWLFTLKLFMTDLANRKINDIDYPYLIDLKSKKTFIAVRTSTIIDYLKSQPNQWDKVKQQGITSDRKLKKELLNQGLIDNVNCEKVIHGKRVSSLAAMPLEALRKQGLPLPEINH